MSDLELREVLEVARAGASSLECDEIRESTKRRLCALDRSRLRSREQTGQIERGTFFCEHVHQPEPCSKMKWPAARRSVTWLRAPVRTGRRPAVHQPYQCSRSFLVRGHHHVDVSGRAHNAVTNHGNPADNDVSDACLIQIRQDLTEIGHEFRTGAWAAKSAAIRLRRKPSASRSSGSRPPSRTSSYSRQSSFAVQPSPRSDAARAAAASSPRRPSRSMSGTVPAAKNESPV